MFLIRTNEESSTTVSYFKSRKLINNLFKFEYFQLTEHSSSVFQLK